MADTDQHVPLLDETHDPNSQVVIENCEMLTVPQAHGVHNGGMGEDILQQAFDEASGGYDDTDVEYATEENIAVVADANGTLSDTNGVTYSYVTAVPNEHQLETSTIAQTIATTQPAQSLLQITPNAHAQVATVSEVPTIPSTNSIVTNQNVDEHSCQPPQVVQVHKPPQVAQQIVQSQNIQPSVISGVSARNTPPQIQQTHVQLSQTDSGTPGSITVLTNSGVGGEPLGSSGNPIRIIQQGNKYTSVQQLTPEQVAQIMQVVQQQQLAQTTTAGGGSSVLFNPQTQTRIVYRVIYPSELHSKTGSPGTIVSATGLGKATPKTITVPTRMLTLTSSRRPYRKRLKDEDDKVDGPNLTREEKEMRKKHRPRTRSGRVSRPPKHMVQDYKHIHHLDWEEDQDDSDGGYSDYKVTDDEEAEKRSLLDPNLLDSNINSAKPKRFPCDKCDKAYIGAAGLARHYRLNPDHGNAEDVLPTGNERRSLNGEELTNFADDSSTQDSISSTTSLHTPITTINTPIAMPATTEALSTEVSRAPTEFTSTVPAISSAVANPTPVLLVSPPKPVPPRGAARAKQHYVQENTPTRRKSRLKELVRQCTDEELMEVVLPRLSRVITTWEFLLMKVERGRPSKPHIGDMLTEYEALHEQVEKTCRNYLSPLRDSPEGNLDRHNNVVQMKSPVIAESLGLNMGKYSVREAPKRDDSTFQYKLLTTAPTNIVPQNIQLGHGTGKRTIQVVTPDQLVAMDNPLKKPRLTVPCISPVNESSGNITQSIANKVFTEEKQGGVHEIVPENDGNVSSIDEAKDDSTGTLSKADSMNIAEVSSTVNDESELMTVSIQESTQVLIPNTSEAFTGVADENVEIKDDGHRAIIPDQSMSTCSAVLPQISEEGITVNDLPMPAEETHSEVAPNMQMPDPMTAVEPTEDGPLAQTTEQKVEESEMTQVSGEENVNQSDQAGKMVDEEKAKSQLQSHLLGVGQLPDIAGGGDPQGQSVIVSGIGQQQLQQLNSQPMLSEDGQTVLYTNDGGQTFYQQQPDEIAVDPSQTQVALEGGVSQFVAMETPDGLVEGQLVTNEDGTQFLIPHQEAQEQALYQTPDGLIVIQNPDGTLRILSNGDPQIPLEAVQALLAGEGQINVENNALEEGTQ